MKKCLLIPVSGTLLFATCGSSSSNPTVQPTPVVATAAESSPAIVERIPLPAGYRRIPEPGTGFAAYLRTSPLKKDKTVYLYNGTVKANQQAQYAVLDISVGNRDLQQCADAVMRLRAEYLFAAKKYDAIRFHAGDGTWLSYTAWLDGTRYKQQGQKLVAIRTRSSVNTHDALLNFMDFVFAYCGTSTLPASLQSKSLEAMQPGDVFLKPGSPGHAVIVMDMAVNPAGEKRYLLAQSYMPAQSIHILNNPVNQRLSPWYTLNGDAVIQTPEWTFYKNQLYGWK